MNPTIIGTIIALILTSGYFVTARAQSPAQMQYEQQQREYRQQMERQQQEQQRQQQIMQENARRQQEEMNRLNRPPASAPNYGTPSPTTPNYGSRPQQQQSGGGSASSGTASPLPTGPAPAAPAPPRSWVKLASTKTQDIYADPASIKPGSRGRLMPNIRNFKEYQEKFGKSYLSVREVWSHDCDNQRSKAMGWTYYAQHNAQGTVIDRSSPDQMSGSWYQPNEMGGLIGQLLKVACNN